MTKAMPQATHAWQWVCAMPLTGHTGPAAGTMIIFSTQLSGRALLRQVAGHPHGSGKGAVNSTNFTSLQLQNRYEQVLCWQLQLQLYFIFHSIGADVAVIQRFSQP